MGWCCGWVLSGGCLGRDVEESKRARHESRDAVGQLADLRLNVCQVSVAAPASKLFDETIIKPSKFEVHGATGAEAV